MKSIIRKSLSRRLWPILLSASALFFARFPASALIDASLQMQLGNPSGATADTNNHYHYLIQRAVEAIDYSDYYGQPNWASWDLTAGDANGAVARLDNFATDTNLPPNFHVIPPNTYGFVNSQSYDRGHMCPSADRTDTRADNDTLFLMSNMIPQASAQNRYVWNTFEGYCRDTLVKTNGNELLIMCGPYNFWPTKPFASGLVGVASNTWKIAVVVPLGSGTALSRITNANPNSIRVIALEIPNTDAAGGSAWTTFITSVKQIQNDTGYNFFSALPNNLAWVLRSKVDGQTPAAPGAISFSPASGAAGATVTLTGTGLDTVTNVTFNGSIASYTITSPTQITATVPAVATTGTITVQGLGGNTTSASSFAVSSGGGSPDLAVSCTHTGNFTQGDTGDTYTVIVTNLGTAASSTTVTVVDSLPTGLTATAISGTGWTTNLGTITCTRADAVAAGAAYPPITVTVSVATNAAANITNIVTVSGGGETNAANHSVSDLTAINAAGTPTVTTGAATGVSSTTVTLNGIVNPNGQPATARFDYGLTTNYGATAAVSGTLTGTTAQTVSANLTELTAGTTYHFRLSATNLLGSTNGLDQTFATPLPSAPDLAITATHASNFTQGDTGDTYTVIVTNAGTVVSSGTVTVVDTLPAGLTATNISGTGWTINLGTLTCTRTNSLAVGAAYPPITVTVSVAANAAATVTNTVTVSGGGDANSTNNTASDPTSINPASAPIATTGAATGVGTTNATLSATINPNGQTTIVQFQYGTDLSYGSSVAVSGTFTGATGQAISANLTDLAASTLYHFRVIATNVLGSAIGSDQAFATIATPVPDLAINAAHAGNFTQGDRGDTYTITVTNTGAGASSGMVTVSNVLPSELTATSLSGSGWTVNQANLTCIRSDALAAGTNYPAITLKVNVASNAPTGVTFTAIVSGGGETNLANNSFSDFTAINAFLGTATNVVISQIYGGGGNSGATYLNDFVELFNPLSTPVNLSTWSVQYTSALGTTWANKANLSGSIQPHHYYLVQLASQNSVGIPLPMAEATNVTINMSASTGGKVALVNNQTALTGSNPIGISGVVDFVGYGTANAYEGAGAALAPPGNTNSLVRKNGGYTDSNDNSTDFVLSTPPAPRNSASPANPVPSADLIISIFHAGNFTQGDSGDSYTITVANLGPAATAGIVNVSDTLPAGLIATSISGSGWATNLTNLTCIRSDALPAGTNYPPITVTVNVLASAPTSVTNVATVSGGGDVSSANNTASDPTTILAAAAPTTITITANGVGTTTATLNGTVNPNGQAATVAFEYGTDTSYGSVALVPETLTGSVAQAVGASLTNLLPGTAYHFRVTATNVLGSSTGLDQTFNTAVPEIADLAITATHASSFTQGDIGNTYTLIVTNVGNASSSGTVTVTDTLPTGLTVTAINGEGWTTNLDTLTCTRADALAVGAAYPPITITMNVAADAAANITNAATVSGGGDVSPANNTASDPTIINPAAAPTTITGAASSVDTTAATLNGTVNPNGQAATVAFEYGTDTSYGSVASVPGTLTGSVAQAVEASLTDLLPGATYHYRVTATNVLGSSTGLDQTFNTAVPEIADLAITATHASSFTQGDIGNTYTLIVTNAGNASSSGTVTVTDTLPTGLTVTAINGEGWTTNLDTLTCTRTGALAAGATYPPITVTVNVAADAAANITNTATVSGGGDVSPANNTAGDPTIINPAAAPTTITGAADGVGTTTATLNGTVNPNGQAATVAFEYGTDTSYGSVALVPETLTGSTAQAVGASLTGLLAGTAYHFRVTATNVLGSSAGLDQTFNTAVPEIADLSITATHASSFTQGDIGNTYTLIVTNVGNASSSGTVTVTDTLPTGLTVTAINGEGWTTNLEALTCTRADALAVGAAYPPITITVNVADDAAANITNTATVSGGGDVSPVNNTAGDPTIINPAAAPTTITGAADGVGTTTATLNGTVNPNGQAATVAFEYGTDTSYGSVASVPETLTGSTAQAVGASPTDLLPGTAYHFRVTATNVLGSSAGLDQTFNTAVPEIADLAITATHASSFTQGDIGNTYTLIVTNVGNASSSGTVTVVDALPTGLTVTAINGEGWTTNLETLTCTRADALTAGAAYPPITITVNVAADAAANITNTATVSGGGDASPANNTAGDPTTIVPLMPVEAWRLQWFGTITNSGPAADTAIATSDGMPNLLKYALGLNPLVATNDPVVGDISTGYLRLSVPKSPEATDISFYVELTDDLTATWTTNGTTIDVNTATLLEAHANAPVATSAGGFIRLRVARP